ncbi:MarR family EPS-associated transcriptional regulator [Alcanivorax sp. 1008]|uniref:MarR family EPS-associated transcriptional regulator n=1 Tax=Alcanivorax sp. 1008 TaxID=2816853 RepID=UPI001DB005D8|nr:MarR family EPS-associated transcriptional regulator [Alcanivorax sp. 1008]MCC1495739.1 MarR family EPS-associated transcriptional regulator [Alcanivorax sp. 1008]
MIQEDSHYKLMRLIEQNPELSQRELAKALGVSLGKANYCVKALIEKGWVKANNFRSSKNKLSYAYLLTPEGIEQKALLTRNFLQRKMQEYEALQQEIRQLKKDMQGTAK